MHPRALLRGISREQHEPGGKADPLRVAPEPAAQLAGDADREALDAAPVVAGACEAEPGAAVAVAAVGTEAATGGDAAGAVAPRPD